MTTEPPRNYPTVDDVPVGWYVENDVARLVHDHHGCWYYERAGLDDDAHHDPAGILAREFRGCKPKPM